jgi:hypothetical protein
MMHHDSVASQYSLTVTYCRPLEAAAWCALRAGRSVTSILTAIAYPLSRCLLYIPWARASARNLPSLLINASQFPDSTRRPCSRT